MSWSSYASHLSARGYKPSAADKVLKNVQQKRAVKELWLLITAIIAFLFVIRLLRLVLSALFYSRPSTTEAAGSADSIEKLSLEDAVPGRNGRASWRRIPAALASGFRVVAFRIQVPIGVGVASLAELFFIWGYIAAMLSFTLTNCESDWSI